MGKKFKVNPFSGIRDNDIAEIIVPTFDVEELANKINTTTRILVELNGKQGRGKTTHLTFLAQHLSDTTSHLKITASTANVNEVLQHPADCLIIDGFYHFNTLDRIKILKAKAKVIYPSHTSMVLERLLAFRKATKINLAGTDKHQLQKIINNRLNLAEDHHQKKESMSLEEVEKLIKKYGNNHRVIINHLYDEYRGI